MKLSSLLKLFTLLLIVTVGCTATEEEILINDNSKELSKSNGRSIEEASKIVTDALGILNDNNSRSADRTFNASTVKVKCNINSRSANPDTLYYVFNFDNNKGFAIVTYNRHAEALLAITEEGNYIPSEKTGVDGFDGYIAQAESYLSNLPPASDYANIPLIPGFDTIPDITLDDTIPNPNPGLTEYKFEKVILNTQKIEPNYNLKWGQHYPAGELFENNTTGCTNIALAMCFSYIMKPTSVTLTYPERTSESIAINWALLKEHKYSYDGCAYETHEMLSKLCKELGYRNHSVCNGDTGTSTYRKYVVPTIRSLGFDCSERIQYSFETVLNTLRDKNIVFASGDMVRNDSIFGHAFVLDGIIYEKYWSGEYIREPGKDWELSNDHGIQYTKMTHVNWGWDGLYNGFFGTAPFCAVGGTHYDNPYQTTNPQNYRDYYYDNVHIICIYK